MQRGDVYRFKVPKGVGHEQQGERYGVVVQSDVMLPRSVVVAAPTSRSAKPSSFRPEVEVAGELTRVLVEQLGAVDVQRLGRRVGRLTAEETWSVDDALVVVLGLDLPSRAVDVPVIGEGAEARDTHGMAVAEHGNVELVRRGFAALTAGDLETGVGLFSPDLTYIGGDQFGRTRQFNSRDEFLGMAMEAMTLNDEFSNELVDVYAVGDSLVMMHVRGHRKSRASGEVLDTDYVMALRIEDGVVTHGTDLIDLAAESYFERLADS